MARIINVDFTGVESGGGFVRVPEGDYGVKLSKIVGKKGESSGQRYFASTFEITQGNKRGIKKSIRHSFSLQKQSLWNLRNFLEACGKTVPAGPVKLDLDKMAGLECAATVMDDTPYEGKIKSIISAFFPIDDLGKTSETGEEVEEEAEAFGGEEGEEEEAPKKSTKKKKKPAKKEEEEAEEEAEESSEDEEAEDLFS